MFSKKKEIGWGIIGVGDVCEIKSGPAFNTLEGSKLVAVMRRNAALARDYAQRHGVPKWYDNADDLIHDPEVD
ncbi:MAG: Gfo/Idh/MocA family oxidoreductase, partial [Saprospiraceae bacterium]